MNQSILLSICIPTYNRANYLDKAIESIVSQIDHELEPCVEICISDNASIDATKEVIEQWRKKTLVEIIYHCNQHNEGADRNYLQVVNISSGKYCWLMGSDDCLVPGAIQRMLLELKNEYDIYLCNRIECTVEMKPLGKRCWLEESIPDSVFDFADRKQLERYFLKARTLGAVFSYLSSIIVKRKKWINILYDNRFTGTAYSHAYILLSIIAKGARMQYIQDGLVLCRLNNDSFATEGVLKRFLLDIDGYLMIGNAVFEEYDIRKKFFSVILCEKDFIRILKIRILHGDVNEWKCIRRKLELLGCSSNLLICLHFLEIRIISTIIRRSVVFLKQIVKPSATPRVKRLE